MKKLMVMIAAVATAFGLYADTGFKDGTSFEVSDSGKDAGYTANAVLTTAGAWTVNDTDNANTIKAGTALLPTGVTRPKQYVDNTDTQAQYLEIKTALAAGKELVRAVGEAFVDGGLYYDSLVNFTAFDASDAPPADADAKLSVWLRENEDGTSNIMVRAYSTVEGNVEDYECSVDLPDLSGWHRLTIKAIGDIGENVSGFVVFVDGVRATCSSANKGLPTGLTPVAKGWGDALFRTVGANGMTAITSAAFVGRGAVDDIAVTTTAPDFEPKMITVTVGSNVVSYDVGVETYTDSRAFELAEGEDTIWINNIKYDETKYGPVSMAIGEDTTIASSGDAAASFDGVGYQYLTGDNGAVEAANLAENGGTLKLLADAKAAIVIESVVEDATITLDLNGKNVTVASGTAILASSDVVITNSVADGNVTGVVANDDCTLTIMDGVFDGAVQAGDDGEIVIWGGRFLASANADLAQDATIMPEDKTLVADGDTGYLVVGDKPQGPFSGGTGTAADPYQIADADDLKTLADFVADGSNTVGVCFLQTADIVWTDADGSFPGIGAANKANNTTGAFQGTYDGGNKTIKDILFCAATSGQTTTYRGVFNKVANATIKNLVVDTVKLDSTMTTANEIGGALVVGNSAGTTTFQNVTSKGYWNEPSDIANGATHNLAGICCRIDATKVYFIACTNEAALYCKYTKCGGMASYAQCDVDFTNCCNKGTLWMNVNATLYKDPHASGVGGMIGMPTGTKTITFTGCVNSGLIGGDHGGDAAKLNKGQLIGATNNSNPTLVDNGGNIGRDDLPSFGSSQGTTTTPDTKFAFQFATGNGDGTVTFCDKPAAAGSYKVMGKNALAISFGTAEGDQLVLDATVADYSGTVTSAVDGMDAVASVEGKITTYTIHEPIAAIKLTVTYDANITQVKVGETVVSASGTEIDVMPGSPYAITVTGKDFYQFAFGTLTGCAAQDVTGLAITINSDAAAASMAITATKYDPQDIADDPRPASSIAADLGIMNGKAYLGGYGLTDKQRLAKVVTWGETKGSLTAINKITFSNRTEDLPDQGTGPDPVNAEAEAFLLDCAVSELETAKAAFKIPAFEIDAEGNVSFGTFEDGGDYGNGHLKQLGATAVDGKYTEDCEDPSFFKFALQK